MGVSPLGLVTAQSLSASIAKMLKTIHQNIWRQMSWGNCWRLQVEYPSFAPRVAYELSISSGKRWIHHLSASKAYTAAAFGFNHAPTDGRRSTWQPCRWPPGKVRAMSGNREWHLQKLSFRLQKPLELIAPGPDSLRSRADFWLTMGKCSGKLISIGQWALVSSYWLFSWLVDWMVSWLVGCLAAHSVGKNVILIEFRGARLASWSRFLTRCSYSMSITSPCNGPEWVEPTADGFASCQQLLRENAESYTGAGARAGEAGNHAPTEGRSLNFTGALGAWPRFPEISGWQMLDLSHHGYHGLLCTRVDYGP